MERKLKICSDCGKPSVLWRSTPKLCKDCAMKPGNQKKDLKKIQVKKELNVFFAKQALVFPERCEECDERLNGYTMFDRRKSTCHILPKTAHGGFPSVATHPANKMFLCCGGGCHGHETWDASVDNRINMKVYNMAVERFKTFESSLTPHDHNKALKYLNLKS